ncbi:MAG: nucleotidyltransferase [Butyrivibrio sp.]|nr:nucleotidyltransferase [Acetatifactor muris]MCM1560603.1 nucleotidyltransferase [Butyrivibrio sp.]
MKVNGIIAEYNPFHNGHKYHLEESKRLTGADYSVAVISGNFIQRGDPALVDKHTRAEMALKNGADLVLELPTVYSASSAEYFATGAVSLLDKLGVVTHLSFGSECGDTVLLSRIAAILLEEPEDYKADLKAKLKQGLSYPSARNSALIRHCPELAENSKIFSSPNNILAIEYIKAIMNQNSKMEPVTVRRLGAEYHDPAPSSGYCSALAIRQALAAGRGLGSVAHYMPDSVRELLAERLVLDRGICANDFSSALYYKLLSEKESGFDKYLDVSADLSNRICKHLTEYKNFDDFCDLLKTKELTYTRISRCLLHILLNLTKEDMAVCSELKHTPYARILGFRKDAEDLLGTVRAQASIPLVTKLADAEKILPTDTYLMLKQDILISQLYYGVAAGLAGQQPANEFSIPLVIV